MRLGPPDLDVRLPRAERRADLTELPDEDDVLVGHADAALTEQRVQRGEPCREALGGFDGLLGAAQIDQRRHELGQVDRLAIGLDQKPLGLVDKRVDVHTASGEHVVGMGGPAALGRLQRDAYV